MVRKRRRRWCKHDEGNDGTDDEDCDTGDDVNDEDEDDDAAAADDDDGDDDTRHRTEFRRTAPYWQLMFKFTDDLWLVHQ